MDLESESEKKFDFFEENKMSEIAFQCHHCNNNVIRDSKDHDHSIVVGDDLWFCSYCYEEDHHIQYIPEEEETDDEQVLVKCDFCGMEEDSDEMIKGVKGVACPDCRNRCDGEENKFDIFENQKMSSQQFTKEEKFTLSTEELNNAVEDSITNQLEELNEVNNYNTNFESIQELYDAWYKANEMIKEQDLHILMIEMKQEEMKEQFNNLIDLIKTADTDEKIKLLKNLENLD